MLCVAMPFWTLGVRIRGHKADWLGERVGIAMCGIRL